MEKLQLTGQNLGEVFQLQKWPFACCRFMVLRSQTGYLKLEISAQTTSRFSPVRYRAPRVSPLCSKVMNIFHLTQALFVCILQSLLLEIVFFHALSGLFSTCSNSTSSHQSSMHRGRGIHIENLGEMKYYSDFIT